MVRVGIYGASGYAGFELLKLLHQHPQVQVVWATSRSNAGQNIRDSFPTTIDQPLIAAEEADLSAVDVVFCSLPHGVSVPLVQKVLEAGKKVIDLSDALRLNDPEDYQRRRGKPHEAPELLSAAVYGLPELHRERIKQARVVANPGCYPTTVILAVKPLVDAGLLADNTVIVDSKSGVSGAGRSLSLKTHFGEAHENFSAYNIGRTHRHIAEMEQETGVEIIFSPHLLPVFRGILSTIYLNLKPGTNPETVRAVFEERYANERFVSLLPAGRLPELRHAVDTNSVVLGIQPVDVERGRYIIVSVEDNLVKGAAGQAIQNMNLMFGLDEATGLRS
jgi:N-acetyl-gamma-glutamyl-phosphate reductase, common form